MTGFLTTRHIFSKFTLDYSHIDRERREREKAEQERAERLEREKQLERERQRERLERERAERSRILKESVDSHAAVDQHFTESLRLASQKVMLGR